MSSSYYSILLVKIHLFACLRTKVCHAWKPSFFSAACSLFRGKKPSASPHDQPLPHDGRENRSVTARGRLPASLGQTEGDRKTKSPPEDQPIPRADRIAQDKHRDTGRKRRDAPCRPCRLRHERRARVLVGCFRLKLSEPRHSSRQGKHYQNPSILL